MNGTFAFVLSIVAIVMFARVLTMWIKHRSDKPAVDEELEATLGRIDQLEERIGVLERIVTENRVDLKQQIDNL